MVDSIFSSYHVAPILCCTTSDLGIVLCKIEIFGAALGIFGVAFVKALWYCVLLRPPNLER